MEYSGSSSLSNPPSTNQTSATISQPPQFQPNNSNHKILIIIIIIFGLTLISGIIIGMFLLMKKPASTQYGQNSKDTEIVANVKISPTSVPQVTYAPKPTATPTPKPQEIQAAEISTDTADNSQSSVIFDPNTILGKTKEEIISLLGEPHDIENTDFDMTTLVMYPKEHSGLPYYLLVNIDNVTNINNGIRIEFIEFYERETEAEMKSLFNLNNVVPPYEYKFIYNNNEDSYISISINK